MVKKLARAVKKSLGTVTRVRAHTGIRLCTRMSPSRCHRPSYWAKWV